MSINFRLDLYFMFEGREEGFGDMAISYIGKYNLDNLLVLIDTGLDINDKSLKASKALKYLSLENRAKLLDRVNDPEQFIRDAYQLSGSQIMVSLILNKNCLESLMFTRIIITINIRIYQYC